MMKSKQKENYELILDESDEAVTSPSTVLERDEFEKEEQDIEGIPKKTIRSTIQNALYTPVKLIMDRRRKSNADNMKFLQLLALARDSSEERMKKIYKVTSENPVMRAWNEGPLQPFCLWLAWLFVGTMFYGGVNFDGDYGKGFYYSVNVGYSIGWGVLRDHSTGCKVFSIFYILAGALFVSRWLAYLLENAIKDQDNNAYDRFLLQRNIRRNNPFRSKSKILSEIYVYVAMNSNRLLVIYLWLIYVFVGAAWSCVVIEWSMIDGVYFSLSSLSTGGLWGIPVDSPDVSFVLVGLFAATGVPLMGMAMADLAALIVALRQQTQASLFAKVDLNQQEKLLLDIFRNDPERGYIDKNEFLLFHLVKRKLVPLNAIREIYSEFEKIDINGAGVITYRDIANLKERKRSEATVTNPLQSSEIIPPDDNDTIR